MEGYHLSPLHAKTLHPVTPTALCEKLPDGDAFTGYRANFHPQCPERGPYHPDLTLQERRSDVFYCVYPSFVVGFCPDFTLYMCIRPLTPDSVAIRWGVTGIADDPKSPEVESYLQFCKEFCAEDRAQLERLQRGLTSRSYVPGPPRARIMRRALLGHHPIHGRGVSAHLSPPRRWHQSIHEADKMFLRNAWYVAALDIELEDGPSCRSRC